MLQAVRTIHDARIVHADLKPANFMLVQASSTAERLRMDRLCVRLRPPVLP
jgi:hypothetical protein